MFKEGLKESLGCIEHNLQIKQNWRFKCQKQ
jgi:hypothetical protein